MRDNALPHGANSNFEECSRELEKGNVVRLFPNATNADTEIVFAHQGIEPGYLAGAYEIEFITPFKPIGIIADLVDDNTPVRPSGTGPFLSFERYQTLEDLMKVVVSEYRGWVAGADAYENLMRQPNRLTF